MTIRMTERMTRTLESVEGTGRLVLGGVEVERKVLGTCWQREQEVR